jgi:hypothetical protein
MKNAKWITQPCFCQKYKIIPCKTNIYFINECPFSFPMKRLAAIPFPIRYLIEIHPLPELQGNCTKAMASLTIEISRVKARKPTPKCE